MQSTLNITSIADTRRRVMLAMVFAGLVSAPVSWGLDGITPSMIVYPILLAIGLVRVSRGAGGAYYFVGVALLFLVIHLPFTWAAITSSGQNPFNSSSPYNPVEWLISLFVLPLTLIVAALRARVAASNRLTVPT
jgi:hypothetical protein